MLSRFWRQSFNLSYHAPAGGFALAARRQPFSSGSSATLLGIYDELVEQKGMQRDEQQIRLLKVLEDTQDEKSELKSVYIHGGVGTGKSFCMDAFYEYASVKFGKKRWHFHEFMLSTHQRVHNLKMKDPTAQDPLKSVGREIAAESGRLLCFDEFQVTDIGDAMILKRLLETVFQQGTRVVFTSNRHPKELYLNGLNRHLFFPCIALLEEKCHIFDIGNGADYRAMRLRNTGDGPGFHMLSSHPELPSRLQTWKEHFSKIKSNDVADQPGPAVASPLTVSVAMGRQFEVPVGIRGCFCELDFEQACATAKSAHDYLALAKVFPAVILKNVPQMSAEKTPDLLRRFITLVDAIYEERNLLVLTSNVALDEILLDSCSEQNSSDVQITVTGEGGSSGRSTTMVGHAEWSATGRHGASLAGLTGAAEANFAQARALSRIKEMLSAGWFEEFQANHNLHQ